ncbi:hypothetical protein HDU79_001440 [Rhizoclosmatium sp. JEL0117]|nr:hypothetical protein HDU79_001440 [Rhizoclosmatium sp. JEL0117]
MVKELALDVDPDDSADSLVKLMIPREKEERRRIFWSFYEVLTSNAAVSPSYTKLDISGDSVKAPSQVLDPHSVFRSDNVVHHTANIFNLIASIKQAWAATPLSISDVFNMITDSCLRDQFDTVITSIPQQYLLLSETLFSDINIEGPRYLQQIKTSNTYVTELNLIYHSSISVFHRPVMFLSALPSCHPSKLNPRDREVLATAINKCIESALRILSIFDFICFTLYTAGIDVLPPEDRWMHRVYTDAYPLFEAVVCLWFASCRMDPAWYTLTHFSTEFNSPKLRQRLEWLVGAYPALEVGAVTPIFKAMSLILVDLQHVAEVGRDYVFNTSIVDGVEALTLGMRVMAVGVTQEDESAPVIDPYCYLGLLGMEIGKNIRWRGQTEDSWRLFWKLKA